MKKIVLILLALLLVGCEKDAITKKTVQEKNLNNYFQKNKGVVTEAAAEEKTAVCPEATPFKYVIKKDEPKVRKVGNRKPLKRKKLKDTYTLKSKNKEEKNKLKNLTCTAYRWDTGEKGLKLKYTGYKHVKNYFVFDTNYCCDKLGDCVCVASSESVETIAKKNSQYFDKIIDYCNSAGEVYKAALFYKDNNYYVLYNTGKKYKGHYLLKYESLSISIAVEYEATICAPFPSHLCDINLYDDYRMGYSWIENHIFNLYTFEEMADFYEEYLGDIVNISESKKTITILAKEAIDEDLGNIHDRYENYQYEIDFLNHKVTIKDSKGAVIFINGTSMKAYVGNIEKIKCKNKIGSTTFAYDTTSDEIYIIRNDERYLWNYGEWFEKVEKQISSSPNILDYEYELEFKELLDGQYIFEGVYKYKPPEYEYTDKMFNVVSREFTVKFDRYGKCLKAVVEK